MLWGGRFKDKLNDSAFKFSSSLSFDVNLIHEDIAVSVVHTEMLAEVKIISSEDADKIIAGLNIIQDEYDSRKWKPDIDKFEDIHSAIESRLYEVIGETAGKLHTGRSRNDQVATDLRLWIKKSIEEIIHNIFNLQNTLVEIAEKHVETIMPGYTHLQRAQPVSLAFHLLAYVEMLERDKERFDFVFKETDVSPLGAGALAGSTLPLDPDYSAKKLGFDKTFSNALDVVSDRDFALDFINGCAIGMMHLSKLSEELILWSTMEWNFIKLSDSFSTGSSLMPQKKNPDPVELIRGKAGRVFGNYVSLISTLKGLALSYNRDLQEDKEPLFDSFKTYTECLKIMEQLLNSIEISPKRFEKELQGDFSLATDLCDWLVLQGIPFRNSHEIVGKLVKYAENLNKNFAQLTIEDLKKINPVFNNEALKILNSNEFVLYRKQTKGSPNPDLVKEELSKWKSILFQNRANKKLIKH